MGWRIKVDLPIYPRCIARNRVQDKSNLRKKLRKNPRWIEGHLQLGELSLQSHLKSMPSPRLVACMRVSARAALEIDSRNPRALCLLGMVQFLEKDYEAAAEAFQNLLNSGLHLSQTKELLVKEHLAAALLTLGREEEAREIFQSIESSEQSAETKMAIKYLATKERQL